MPATDWNVATAVGVNVILDTLAEAFQGEQERELFDALQDTFYGLAGTRVRGSMIMHFGYKATYESCRQVHLTRHFFMQLHNSFHAYHTAWLKTSHPTCLYARTRTIHDVCLSVLCLSIRVCPSPVSLRRLPLFFPDSTCTLTALHLQCQQRRWKQLLRLRTTRSSAPWRKTILPRERAKQGVRLPDQVQGFLLLRRANLSTQARIAI